jgi:hypothetical protein
MRKPLLPSVTTTEDGTTIIVDPDVGTVSRRTREEAEAEVRRLKALRAAA